MGRDPDDEIKSQARQGAHVCFDRDNAAIERHRGLRVIIFHNSCFEGLDGSHEGLKRLFSTVIPDHPTLNCVCFDKLAPTLPFKLLTEGLQASRNVTNRAAASDEQGSSFKLVNAWKVVVRGRGYRERAE